MSGYQPVKKGNEAKKSSNLPQVEFDLKLLSLCPYHYLPDEP